MVFFRKYLEWGCCSFWQYIYCWYFQLEFPHGAWRMLWPLLLVCYLSSFYRFVLYYSPFSLLGVVFLSHMATGGMLSYLMATSLLWVYPVVSPHWEWRVKGLLFHGWYLMFFEFLLYLRLFSLFGVWEISAMSKVCSDWLFGLGLGSICCYFIGGWLRLIWWCVLVSLRNGAR